MTLESNINVPNNANNANRPISVGIVSGRISVSSGRISLYTASGSISEGNPLPVAIAGGGININVSSGLNLSVSVTSGQFSILSGQLSVSSGNTSLYTSSGRVSQDNPLPVAISSGAFSNSTFPVSVLSGQLSVSSGNTSLYTSSGQISQSNPLPVAISSGAFSNTTIPVSVLSGQLSVSSGNISIYTASGVVGKNNPLPVAISSGAFSNTTIPVSFAAGTIDSLGRLRISNPFTVFESQHRYQINDKWNYQTTNGGSIYYDINGSLVNMNTSLASGSQVIAETKRVMPYQPGKSLVIYNTFAMSPAQNNLRQRFGYFGEQNGIYFEVDGSSVNFVKRSYVTGSVVETKATRNGVSNWNIDNLDGTGPSGYNLSNYSSSLILFIEIDWLGVGDVRVGFILNSEYVPCHVFRHTPVGGSPIIGTYMTTACLPLRAEITNTGTIVSTGNLKQICSTVVSEGGYEGFSKRCNVDLATTPKTLENADQQYPVISLRIASGRLDSVVIPSNLNAIVTSYQDIQYKMILNATISGAIWTTHQNGNVQYDVSATSIASGSGTNIAGGYVNKQGFLDISNPNQFNSQIGRLLDGTSETLTVVFAPTSPNTKVLADLSWLEIV
jgi:hypothetical protein